MRPEYKHDFKKRVFEVIGVAVVYFIVARLSLLLAFGQTNASPVWPPSGIAFAAILLLGYRIWPGIMAGAFFSNVVVFLTNKAAGVAVITTASFFISIGNTLEAVTGGILLRHFIGTKNPTDRVQDVFQFVYVAIVMCLVSSAVGPAFVCLTGIVPWDVYQTIWFTWWIGDTTGILTLAPIFLIGYQHKQPWIHLEWRRLIEFVLFLMLVFLVNMDIFEGRYGTSAIDYPIVYMPILLVVWAAFRFGQFGAGVVILMMMSIAILGTIHGRGPFVTAELNGSLLLLQFFVGIVTVTALSLIAALNERKQAYEGMEEAVRIKSEFTSIVSHELRTPLAIAKEALSLLLRDKVGKVLGKQREILSIANSNLDRLGSLINDILDFSKIEAGKMELHKELLDIVPLLEEYCEEWKLEANVKKIRLELLMPHRPVKVYVDKMRLLQIMSNLINNAIKFSPEQGTVEVYLEEKENFCQFFVKDSGQGIAKEDFSKLFQRFQQLGRNHGPGEQGTGLGLSIIKSLVELHGGEVRVESALGKGTTFIFMIPKIKNFGYKNEKVAYAG